VSAITPRAGPVVLAEIRDGLEVRHQVAGQPHQLDIALALELKPSARLDAIEISINVDLQQRRRVISRPARGKRRDAVKAQLGEIKPIDKDIDRLRPRSAVLVKALGIDAGQARREPARNRIDDV
jgi:hypothetical protein